MKDLTLQELALHMGCECECEHLISGSWSNRCDVIDWRLFASMETGQVRNVRSILRPLWDMTEEEIKEYLATLHPHIGDYVSHTSESYGINVKITNSEDPQGTRREVIIYRGGRYPGILLWLAARSFDLLGLLEDGRAIEKKRGTT